LYVVALVRRRAVQQGEHGDGAVAGVHDPVPRNARGRVVVPLLDQVEARVARRDHFGDEQHVGRPEHVGLLIDGGGPDHHDIRDIEGGPSPDVDAAGAVDHPGRLGCLAIQKPSEAGVDPNVRDSGRWTHRRLASAIS
jgi:hypothetical protein